MSQRTEQFPGQDLVLEHLIEEGIFDSCDPNVPHFSKEFTMYHSTAMVLLKSPQMGEKN